MDDLIVKCAVLKPDGTEVSNSYQLLKDGVGGGFSNQYMFINAVGDLQTIIYTVHAEQCSQKLGESQLAEQE